MSAIATNNEPVTRELPQARLIDIIVYTASLISRAEHAEPLLDVLRRVTAKTSTSLSPVDVEQLHGVQQGLETILVRQEQFRAFTHVALHAHIKKHVSSDGKRVAWRLRMMVLGVFVLAVGAAVVPFGLRASIPADLRPTFAISLFYSVIDVAVAWLMFSAEREITSEVRVAYRYISFCMICSALAVPIQPLIGVLGQQNNAWVPTLVTAPLALAHLPMYLGIRKLAELADIGGWPASFKVVGGLTVVLAGVFAVIAVLTAPLRVGPIPTLWVVMATTAHGVLLVTTLAALVMMWAMRTKMSFLYKRSITALMWPLAASMPLFVYFIVYWFTGQGIEANPVIKLGAVLLVITSTLYLRAGYYFKVMHIL